MKYILTLSFLISQIIFISAYAQAQGDNKEETVISFFLDCDDCDFTFVRQELPFVLFVRNPQLADVHILVTESNTGSGGEMFFLNFIGLRDFKDLNYEYSVISSQSDTDDDIRRSLLKILKIGILPYYSKTSFIDHLNIDIEDSENRQADEMVIDRWHKWVFNLQSGAEFQKEASQNEYSVSTEAGIAKVTEEWKTRVEAEFEINRENYYDDDILITDKQDSKKISADFIKSLSEKWSAGIFTGYSSQTYLNIEHRYGATAGIEYNIFPWKECNRRVFALRYTAGLSAYDYIEETIYDKTKENLFYESFEMNLELIQPWGEISLGLEGRHYLHDFTKTRLTMESDISVRLTRYLSVFGELESEIVHDQLYLPKGDATLEDILLRRRKLATTYEIRGQFGFRFTFGSIYNNVVNERF